MTAPRYRCITLDTGRQAVVNLDDVEERRPWLLGYRLYRGGAPALLTSRVWVCECCATARRFDLTDRPEEFRFLQAHRRCGFLEQRRASKA